MFSLFKHRKCILCSVLTEWTIRYIVSDELHKAGHCHGDGVGAGGSAGPPEHEVGASVDHTHQGPAAVQTLSKHCQTSLTCLAVTCSAFVQWQVRRSHHCMHPVTQFIFFFFCANVTAAQYRYTHSALAVSDTKELVPWLTRGSRHLIENILTLGFPQDGCRQLLYINKALGAEGEDSTYLEHICFHRPRLWRWRWTDVGHGAVCRGDEAPACRHRGRPVETVCRRGQAHRGVEAEKNSFKDFLRFTIDIPDVNIPIDFHQCNVH